MRWALYDGLDLLCVLCAEKVVTADMVHHIVEIEDDWSQRLKVSNLFPLSNQKSRDDQRTLQEG